MPENIITSEGRGETQPFVQTGDGVREQLNRRTEVVVSLASEGVQIRRVSGATSGTTTTTSTSGSTSTLSGFSSSETFMDSEGRPMRLDANGNFVYIDQ